MYSIKPNTKIVVLISAIFYLYTYLCVCLCVCVCARAHVCKWPRSWSYRKFRAARCRCLQEQPVFSLNPCTVAGLFAFTFYSSFWESFKCFSLVIGQFFFNSAEVMVKIQLKIYYHIRSLCEDGPLASLPMHSYKKVLSHWKLPKEYFKNPLLLHYWEGLPLIGWSSCPSEGFFLLFHCLCDFTGFG